MLIPIILAGGAGTRLWPISREHHPKQLYTFKGKHSLLQTTCLRTANLPDVNGPLIITNQHYRFIIKDQLQQIDVTPASILLEPIGRNTAPAIALAALQALTLGTNPLLLVLPTDHQILDQASFTQLITKAIPVAKDGAIVTFGVTPTTPETGYGYIKSGEAISPDSPDIFSVDQFVEKPDRPTAQHYLEEGNYYWNSGMFLMSAATYLEELKKHAPDILTACERAFETRQKNLSFTQIEKDSFAKVRSDSIDYAIMERTDKTRLMPLHTRWHDIGTWPAMWETSEKDESGNVCVGDVVTENVSNSYLQSSNRLLAVLGVTDHIIVDTDDAVLVAHKDRCDDIKKLIQQLKEKKREEITTHQKVYRPWGYYETVCSGPGFKVKKISVNPGGKLSLQSHQLRSEHWVVVSGTAQVVRGEKEFSLEANQSTYIPLGVKHRLWNESNEPLHIIEVQSGNYLGEDDILRYDDIYARTSTV